MTILNTIAANLPRAAAHLTKKAAAGVAEAAVVQCAVHIMDRIYTPAMSEKLASQQRELLEKTGMIKDMAKNPDKYFFVKKSAVDHDVWEHISQYELHFTKKPDSESDTLFKKPKKSTDNRDSKSDK